MRSDRTQYDDKLDSILAAAAELFAAKGYHNASIRDIARATRVSLSGLYYYFQSKEELLYLIQDHAFISLLGELESRLAEVPDPVDRLQLLIRNQLTYFVHNMAEMKVLSHEAHSLTGEYYRRIQAKKKRLKDLAMEILVELRPKGDFDPRVATFALFGMMNWLYTWYRPERDVDVEALAEQMTKLYLGGYLQGDPPGGTSEAVMTARRSLRDISRTTPLARNVEAEA